MHATLPLLKNSDFPAVKRGKLETLQVNLGYRCNQSCQHCHVNAGPNRKEVMSRDNIEAVLDFLCRSGVKTLDLTGGAPEMHPEFRYLVSEARASGVHVIDRCNLTILNEPGYEDMAEFLASQRVELVASLPCYLEENVDTQRGNGVYYSSMQAMHKLNALGYGQQDSGLVLNLMYNPTGPYLPPDQAQLEADYKYELDRREELVFNNLLTLTNMPIQRFGSMLISKGQFDEYMQLLKSAYQPCNLENVMCRSLISVDWQGIVYDCDFNQMLGLPLKQDERANMHLREIATQDIEGNPIVVADHCYGCTAGQGASCGGALST
ncbi:MAG: arsenosugar biosynthesis radical SAM protein ArsS [Granulosicoccaceae bacterium]|jgi:radical SAM/Cys-rich protein